MTPKSIGLENLFYLCLLFLLAVAETDGHVPRTLAGDNRIIGRLEGVEVGREAQSS